MLWLWITLGVLGGLALAFFISRSILVRKLMIPNARPLTDEELAICEKLVAAKKGYPYVCRWALKHKACPCLPCPRLKEAKLEEAQVFD